MSSAAKRRKRLFAGGADRSGTSVTGAQTTSPGSYRSHQTGLSNTSSLSTTTVSQSCGDQVLRPRKFLKHKEPRSESSRSVPRDTDSFTIDKYFLKQLSENEMYQTACPEYSSVEGSDVKIKGRLKLNIEFWRNIGAYDNVLDIIAKGYKLPFLDIPPPACFNNNVSTITNKDLVEEAILELLTSDHVKEVESLPHVVNPLSVSINSSGKKRLILDLRYINQYLVKQSHKLDDWKVMFRYVRKGSFMYTFDLSHVFHGVDICDHHLTFGVSLL